MTRFIVAWAVVIATIACARTTQGTTQLPPTSPPNALPTIIGIVGSYHGPLDGMLLTQLSASTKQMIVLRAAVTSAEQARAIVAAVAPFANIKILWLVEKADGELLEALNPVISRADGFNPTIGIELGNELDLAGLTSAQFGAWTMAAYSALRANGFTAAIVSGGVYSVQPDTLAWLRGAGLYNWPKDLIVGVHRYGNPDGGQQGYDSRTAETMALRGLGRQFAVTEFGYPMHDAAGEAWAADAALRDLAWFHAAGAVYSIWYQITDGPGTSDLDRYGVHTLNGRWKPVLRSLFP